MAFIKETETFKLRENYLILSVKIGVALTTNLDFNRFRYLSSPKVRQIQSGNVVYQVLFDSAYGYIKEYY